MPNSTPKFATKYKFGGRTKKRKVYNFQKKRRSPSEDVDGSLPPVPSAPEDADCGLGLAGESGSDSDHVRQTFRRDTVMLEPADLLKIEKDAEVKLRNLASTPATTRKSGLLACANDTATDDAAAGSDVMETRFALVSLDALNALQSNVKCKGCGGDVSAHR